ncbi:MAG: hypothetical protein ACYCYI_14585 [Saccharofermentanales bacterium]
MQYKFTQNENYEDFACGRVIYNMKGSSNFPVRLAQEIFLRCLEYAPKKTGVRIYDPCCGNGYLLTVLGFLDSDILSGIIGSDIDADAVSATKRNLGLLSITGLDERVGQLERLYQDYNKLSHREAIDSGLRLRKLISHKMLETKAFQADILTKDALAGVDFIADIVITDVPYGNLASWSDESASTIDDMLHNVRPVLHKDSIIAVCSDKKQKISSNEFIRLEKHSIGKRKFEILKLNE